VLSHRRIVSSSRLPPLRPRRSVLAAGVMGLWERVLQVASLGAATISLSWAARPCMHVVPSPRRATRMPHGCVPPIGPHLRGLRTPESLAERMRTDEI
jgi:hypothetical protein